MKLIQPPNHPNTELLIEATNKREHSILQEFAVLKERLTATIEHDPGYEYIHLLIRKDKS